MLVTNLNDRLACAAVSRGGNASATRIGKHGELEVVRRKPRRDVIVCTLSQPHCGLATERHAAETAEAQRWADVEKVNAVLECRAFAVSAAQPRHLRYKDANGSYLDMSNVDLTQDM